MRATEDFGSPVRSAISLLPSERSPRSNARSTEKPRAIAVMKSRPGDGAGDGPWFMPLPDGDGPWFTPLPGSGSVPGSPCPGSLCPGSSHHLEQSRRALPTADAHRHHDVLRSAPPSLDQRVAGEPRARDSIRVTHGDGAAIHV